MAAARVAIAAEVAATYYTIAELQERLRIARDRATSLDRLQSALRLRVAQGVVAPLELDRFEGEAGAAKAAVYVVEALLAAERGRLGVLVGVDATSDIANLVPPSSGLPDLAVPIDPFEGLAFSLAARPDVIAADARVTAADADTSTARSRRWPRLSLSSLLATIAGGPGALFSSSSISGQGAAGLSVALFDFGRIDAEIAAAQGARREALARYRQTVLEAARDVSVAGQTLALRRGELRQRNLDEATLIRSAKVALTTYDAGAIDLTSALDAERAKLAARDAAVTARAETARSLIAVIRAVAGTTEAETSP